MYRSCYSAVDDDCNQTGQLLAGMLDWPQATFASKIEVKDGIIEVTREVDSGLQTIKFKPPGIITCDLRLNTPKIASIPAMMKAKKAVI
jgi:electron transfer flavoprotein beta subunit